MAVAEDYLRSRGIRDETLVHFALAYEADEHGNALFRHGNGGAEIKGPGRKHFTLGEKSYWMHGPDDAEVIVVAESALDALAHAQTHGLPERTLYVSHGGRCGDHVFSRIAEMAAAMGADLLSAADNDEHGERYAQQLAAAADEVGLTAYRDMPPVGKDWTDALVRTEGGAELRREL
jgi:hypothetical protein